MTILMSAGAVGLVAGVAAAVIGSSPVTHGVLVNQPLLLSYCSAVDGATIRCGAERIRLLGIRAPELPGRCLAASDCAPGDPVASRASLDEALHGEASIMQVGVDRNGETLALVHVASGDLSCRQLGRKAVIYRSKWDIGGRVAAQCPEQAI